MWMDNALTQRKISGMTASESESALLLTPYKMPPESPRRHVSSPSLLRGHRSTWRGRR